VLQKLCQSVVGKLLIVRRNVLAAWKPRITLLFGGCCVRSRPDSLLDRTMPRWWLARLPTSALSFVPSLCDNSQRETLPLSYQIREFHTITIEERSQAKRAELVFTLAHGTLRA